MYYNHWKVSSYLLHENTVNAQLFQILNRELSCLFIIVLNCEKLSFHLKLE